MQNAFLQTRFVIPRKSRFLSSHLSRNTLASMNCLHRAPPRCTPGGGSANQWNIERGSHVQQERAEYRACCKITRRHLESLQRLRINSILSRLQQLFSHVERCNFRGEQISTRRKSRSLSTLQFCNFQNRLHRAILLCVRTQTISGFKRTLLSKGN